MNAPDIVIRQARPDDMIGCVHVFRRSATDLSRRQGTEAPQVRVPDMAEALSHLQRTDPRGFQVAVREGKVVAFAATIVRGNTHFLSMFWALPTLQNQGIGRRLLQRAFTNPRPPAGAVRCVYASLDPRAQVLYLKFGMRPRGMFYMVRGKPARSPKPARPVELVQVGAPGKASRAMLAIAARFDRTFRGTRRDADLRWVMGLHGARFFVARRRGVTIGYAVVNERGRVGPAGVLDPRDSAGLAWAVKERAREMGAESLFVVVPGVNHGALDVFFRAGLRTEFYGAWMAEKPVGSFEGYLLAGGMLL
jgi:GNAT superfamily N-acetyltransferase